MNDVSQADGQPPVLVTVREAALATGVPVAWLKKEVKAGRVPCIRLGGIENVRVRVNLRVVNAALERQAAGEYADSLFGQLPSPVGTFVLPLWDGKTIPKSEPDAVGPAGYVVNPHVGGTPGTV